MYDIRRGTWDALPGVGYPHYVDHLTAVPISQNEIMLTQVPTVYIGEYLNWKINAPNQNQNQGRRPGQHYYRQSYVFNTGTLTYQHVGDNDQRLFGVGCAMKPGEAVLMCARGANDSGSSNR